MKIALDGSLLGARFSGVERSVAQLIRHLPAAAGDQHQFVVFVGKWFDEYVAAFHPEGLDPRLEVINTGIDNRNRFARVWWQQVVLPRLCHGIEADLFHAPAYISPALMSVPHVVTLYDLIAFSYPEFVTPANRWHYRMVLPAGVRNAQRVIVPSAATRRTVARFLPAAYERTVTVPLGIQNWFFDDDQGDDQAIREGYRLPEEYLLWVGNLEPKKNVSLLLRALQQLRSRGAEVPKLAIAGELSWGTNDVMTQFLASNLQSRVVFLGRIPDPHLAAIYRGAKLFLFPSLSEGFGLPPLEAMASGVPVISSDAGALPEVVGEAGLLRSPTDPEAWADAIQLLLDDHELYRDLVAKGRARAADFTWERTALKHLEIYAAAAALGEDVYDHRTGHLLYASD